MTDQRSEAMVVFCETLGKSNHVTEISSDALTDTMLSAVAAIDHALLKPESDAPMPTTMSYILTELSKIPERVIGTDLLNYPSHLEVAQKVIHETLQVLDKNVEMVYTESVAVPVLEHQGPDIQYHHVPATDHLKDLPTHYWNMVNS